MSRRARKRQGPESRGALRDRTLYPGCGLRASCTGTWRNSETPRKECGALWCFHSALAPDGLHRSKPAVRSSNAGRPDSTRRRCVRVTVATQGFAQMMAAVTGSAPPAVSISAAGAHGKPQSVRGPASDVRCQLNHSGGARSRGLGNRGEIEVWTSRCWRAMRDEPHGSRYFLASRDRRSTGTGPRIRHRSFSSAGLERRHT